MPRAKKVVTDALTPNQDLGPIVNELVRTSGEPVPMLPLVTLRYSPEDMQKLDQFAIGLLGPNTGAGHSSEDIFQARVRAAYLRAEVMLTIRKEIAALEA